MSDITRRQKLEAMLAGDAGDQLLRYGLAMEYASGGDHESAVQQFRLLMQNPKYVPAYLMAAQSLQKLGRSTEAIEVLKEGIAAAQKQGNLHAAGEMEGMLESLL